jgi:excisionase family DNA binding protein
MRWEGTRRLSSEPELKEYAMRTQPENNGAVGTVEISPTVFTVFEVARILRLGKISVYQAIERGEIPYVRIGRRILIPRHALEQLLSGTLMLPRTAA